MRGMAGALIGLVLALAPATAHAVEPLPDGSWLVPPDGRQHVASSWPDATTFEMVDFTVYAYYGDVEGAFDVEVARTPDLDPKGPLNDARRIDAYVAPLRAGYWDVFSVRTNVASQWLGVPGTY